MVLIFGGAYQGKLDFAKEKFNLTDADVFNAWDAPQCNYCKGDCTMCSDMLFWNKKIINNFDQVVLHLVKAEADANAFLDNFMERLEDKIVIVNDISQGIVPMEAELRAWREANGRAMLKLSKNAEEVYRVFCGIGEKEK